MFEISQLKEKKLPELQEIAKELNVPKFSSLKKIDLVYQILDLQAANPKIVAPSEANDTEKRPQRTKRERIIKPKDNSSKPQELANNNKTKAKDSEQVDKNPKAAEQNQTKAETNKKEGASQEPKDRPANNSADNSNKQRQPKHKNQNLNKN